MNAKQVDSVHDLATMPPRAVLIIHSADDGLFPPYYAQEMYDSAKEPKELWLIDRVGGHINPITGHEAEYKERILHFFESAFAQQPLGRIKLGCEEALKQLQFPQFLIFRKKVYVNCS